MLILPRCFTPVFLPVFFAFHKPVLRRFFKTTIYLLVLISFFFSMAHEPPPPPEPSVAQILALMMEDREAVRAERTATLATLQHLAQLGANNGNGARSKLKDFQNTNPPVFSKIAEPLDADDWLSTIKNNLEVAGVEGDDKVLFATHFLAGPARTWWETTRAAAAPGHVINWTGFVEKFRKYHILQGVMDVMRDKFLKLKKAGMTVGENWEKFTTLS